MSVFEQGAHAQESDRPPGGARGGSRGADPRRRPAWWRRATSAAVAAVVATGGLVTGTAGPAAAFPPDGIMSFASYNTQGSLNGARWTTDLVQLVSQFPVVALQEAGSGPPLPPEIFPGITEIPVRRHAVLPEVVTHSTWQVGSLDRPGVALVQVYFLQTDPQRVQHADGTFSFPYFGGRVNSAMVTHEEADEVVVLDNPAWDPAHADHYRARALLGLRFGDTWYFDVHARGHDARQLINEVRNFVPAHQNWVAVGDFNVNILTRTTDEAHGSLQLAPDETILRTGTRTHPGSRDSQGGELDFAVTRGLGNFQATVPGGHGSDHFPVYFQPLPVAGGQAPPRATQTYSSVLEAPTGMQVDVTRGGSVIVHPRRDNDNQRFVQLATAGFAQAFQNVRTGECLGLPALHRRDLAAAVVVQRPCTDLAAHWVGEDLDAPGGPIQWRSVEDPFLCLEAPRSQTSLRVQPCTASRDQRFWSTSVKPRATSWDRVEKDVRLVNVALDEPLDVSGGAIREGSGVQTHPHKDVANQLWSIDVAEPGDNLVQIEGTPSGRCLDVRNSDTATAGAQAVLWDCIDHGSKNDGRGHRWTAEMYIDGSLRLRNEATHLCLSAGERSRDPATVQACDDGPRQRWFVR